MADFLMYWKYFWTDMQDDPSDLNNEWHTRQKHFYDQVKKGDNLWVVVFDEEINSNEWRLLQRIVVEKKYINRKNGRPYGIFGDVKKGQVFDVGNQKDFTEILRKLEFVSGKSLKVSGRAIGNAIQRIRPLSEKDNLLLKDYSKSLMRHKADVEYEDLSVVDISLIETEKEIERVVNKGAGFGNPEINRKVEKAAVDAVRNNYESKGWKVKSVESDKCGYDLHCTKNKQELHIEVKGVQGSLPNFIVTRGEVERAKTDKNFIICAVTSALINPKINVFTGVDFIKDFDLQPLAFRATQKKK